MAKHHSYPVEFKRQVAQEYLAGETLYGLAKRHQLSRNLIRIWVARYEAGGFDDDTVVADLMQAQEARIAALERLVGKLTLENEFLNRSFHLGRAQRPDPTRQSCGAALRLLDTNRVEVEQPESGVLEGGRRGVEGEAMLGA